MKARSSQERLAALAAFVQGWFGPRQEEFGEPLEAASARKLPDPLRWFYLFAGRWPAARKDRVHQHFVSRQHELIPLASLKPAQDGLLPFVSWNRREGLCFTLEEGEDPPVWFTGFDEEPWIPPKDDIEVLTTSLSQYLVSLVLEEALFASRLGTSLSDDDRATFGPSSAHSRVLWAFGPAPAAPDRIFYLWRERVLVMWDEEMPWIGCNHDETIAELERMGIRDDL